MNDNFIIMNDNFINITFQNNGKYDERAIHSPIVFGGKAIGFIADVNERTVEGLIWTKFYDLWTKFCDFEEELECSSGSVVLTK